MRPARQARPGPGRDPRPPVRAIAVEALVRAHGVDRAPTREVLTRQLHGEPTERGVALNAMRFLGPEAVDLVALLGDEGARFAQYGPPDEGVEVAPFGGEAAAQALAEPRAVLREGGLFGGQIRYDELGGVRRVEARRSAT